MLLDSDLTFTGVLKLIYQLVPGKLCPSVRLSPVYPGSTHFVGVAVNLGCPCAASNTISSFKQVYIVTLIRPSASGSLLPRLTCHQYLSRIILWL